MKKDIHYIILLTKTTAAQNEDALSYHRMRGLYFLATVFVATILTKQIENIDIINHYIIIRAIF